MEKAKEFQKNIYFCFNDYTKAFYFEMDHNKLENPYKEMEILTTLSVSWETCVWIKKQQSEWNMKQWTGSKLGKEYGKAMYCHPPYLTCIQSISYEMPGWMNDKLESRLTGEISTTSEMQIIPL